MNERMYRIVRRGTHAIVEKCNLTHCTTIRRDIRAQCTQSFATQSKVVLTQTCPRHENYYLIYRRHIGSGVPLSSQHNVKWFYSGDSIRKLVTHAFTRLHIHALQC